MRNRPLPVVASILLVALLSALAGQEQPSGSRPSHYHFIADFSRDQLVVTEMIARPEGHEATGGAGEPLSKGLRMRLPPGAFVFQVGAGVHVVGDEVVLDFAEASDEPYLTWKYVLPIRPGTMSIERILPLPVVVATVIVQEAGPLLDVRWPEGAVAGPSITHTGRYLMAGGREVPAGAPITVVLSNIPGPVEVGGRGWLLWIVAGMVAATVLAVVVGPRRR